MGSELYQDQSFGLYLPAPWASPLPGSGNLVNVLKAQDISNEGIAIERTTASDKWHSCWKKKNSKKIYSESNHEQSSCYGSVVKNPT